MFRHNTKGGRFFTGFVVCAYGAIVAMAQAIPSMPRNPSVSELRTGFRNPPSEARLRCYWWWLNGNTDKPTITHDLEQMKAKGFGGALLVDAGGADQAGNRQVPAGPTFGSPAWIELYTHALREADRLGLEITLNITSGWNLGGPDVTPEQAAKVLTWTRTPVAGGHPVIVKLPMPEARNGFYRQIAVLAYPLAHGRDLAPQPGSHMAKGPVGPGAVEKRSAAILRLRSDGGTNGESGFNMPDASDMLDDEVPGDPKGAAAFADVSEANIQDLTSQVSADGSLSWNPGAGEWEILRIGYTDKGSSLRDSGKLVQTSPDGLVSTGSGAWQGLAIDYLSREAFEVYWDHVVQPLIEASKPFHSLKYLATDSWELGGTNWTNDFKEQFKSRRGYDPVPWLPVVAGRIVGNRDQSTRFLTDFRRTVADLVSSQHYDVFAEKARSYGLGVEAESGGPHGAPIDALETFRNAAVPQTEFWSESAHRATDVSRFFTKEAASAAHIYGQRFIAEEGETSVGPQWSESLATDLKPSFDMGITEGMNRLVWHEFTSSPASTGLPGQEYFAGTHVDPKVTWFNAGTAFFTYLNRAQFLMQQGHPVNDLLYFYGDNTPNFVRLKADDPAHVLPGYDYDVTNEDALLHSIRMDGGRLRGPSGMEWKALALPATRRISFAVLEKIEQFVRDGGIVIGLMPTSQTGRTTLQNQTAFSALATKVWGSECTESRGHGYGKGLVFCTQNAHAAFQVMRLAPDVAVTQGTGTALQVTSKSELDYLHQQIGQTDFYFLRNGSDHMSRQNIIFRSRGGRAELWDAITGEMLVMPAPHLLPDGRSQLLVELAPFGSALVVFTKDVTEHLAQVTTEQASTPIRLSGPWQVAFQPGRGGPIKPITMPELKDWTTWSDPAVRYFSGTATYVDTVSAPELPKGKRVWIHFAEIHEIARVKINGVEAGTVWAKPLTLRVDPYLRPGDNRIEIEVTNLWPNRLIGDQQPGVLEKITSTNITAWKADSALLPSGLTGPVDWLIEK